MKINIMLFMVLFTSASSFSQQNIEFKAGNFKDDKEGYKKAIEAIKTADEYRSAGNEAIYAVVSPKENFKMAIQGYLVAYQFNANSAILNFKLGNCYLYTNERYNALKYLEKAVKLNVEVDPFIEFLHLSL